MSEGRPSEAWCHVTRKVARERDLYFCFEQTIRPKISEAADIRARQGFQWLCTNDLELNLTIMFSLRLGGSDRWIERI